MVVVALVPDLGDEELRAWVGRAQPPGPNRSRGVQLGAMARVDTGGGLQNRGGIGGGLREVDHVAGVHPAADEVEVPAVVGAALHRGVVEMRGVVERGFPSVRVPREELEDRVDGVAGPGSADQPGP
jgi:hypothetical protein